jgi:hypothetical protein
MWDYVIAKIAGHALARSVFRESPEEKAKRIAEEKRKERERFLRELPWMILVLALFAAACFLIWKFYVADLVRGFMP